MAQRSSPSDPMRFPAEQIKPSGASFYGHLFENSNVGLARNLFWSFRIEFMPLRYGESEFECSMTSEWIVLPIRDWRSLEGITLTSNGQPDLEASFYMTGHDPATLTHLSLRHIGGLRFDLEMAMVVDFKGYYRGDKCPQMPVKAQHEAEFQGIVLERDNLFPKPNIELGAVNSLAPFFDITSLSAPVFENGIYRFLPADA